MSYRDLLDDYDLDYDLPRLRKSRMYSTAGTQTLGGSSSKPSGSQRPISPRFQDLSLPSPTTSIPGFQLHLKRMFEEKMLSDVEIETVEGSIMAHKFILVRSPVFCVMFAEKNWREGKNCKVVIDDMKREVVIELVRFLYYDKVEKMDELAFELIEAAEKYDVGDLKIACIEHLKKKIKHENFAEILLFADRLGIKELKDHSMDFIVNNRKKVKDSKGWKLLEANADLLLEISRFFLKH